MKLAILMLCHIDGKQISKFIETLENKNIDIFIHIDSKSKIEKDISVNQHVHILPNELRHDVRWARFSQIEAEYELLKYARSKEEYDYYCLVSGQDFPIHSADNIFNYLQAYEGYSFIDLFDSYNTNGKKNNHDKNNDIVYPEWLMDRNGFGRICRRLWVFISGGYNNTFKFFKRKNSIQMDFFFGSQWWCFHKNFVEWMFDYLNDNHCYYNYFKLCSTPDESFFHTLFMNSPYKNKRKEYLHYIDWTEGKSSPKCLTVDDFESIINSDKFFARKIQNNDALITKLQSKIRQEEYIK